MHDRVGLPAGWLPYDPRVGLPRRPVACHCGWAGTREDLNQVDPDVACGVAAGHIAPAGECPDCGDLAFFADVQIAYRALPQTAGECRPDATGADRSAPDPLSDATPRQAS